MNKSPSTFRSAVDILHSSALFLIAAFTIDIFFISISSVRSLLLLFVSIALKIILYCGFCASAVELASNEEPHYTAKGLVRNLKTFLPIYFLLTLAQLGFEVAITLVAKHNFQLTLTPESLNTNTVFLAVFAVIVVHQKYIKSFKLKRKRISVSLKHVATILLLYIMDILVNNVHFFYPYEGKGIGNLMIMVSIYIQVLSFLYYVFIILENYPEISERYEKDRKLYLVNPLGGGILAGLASQIYRAYPPAFVVLKALSPKSYKVKAFNRVPWKKRFYAGGKLVGITCYTSNSAEAYKIAKEFKKRGSKVVMGGPHVTYLPDEALSFCDSVVVGEAEGVWKDVIKDYESGALKQKYMGEAKEDFHTEVHKELLKSPPDVIKAFLETTRGCKFRCHFCTIPSLSGGKARNKPVEEIVELIKKVKDKHSTFVFIDNNIYSDPAYARALFKALIPLKIKWYTQCTIDIVKNEETLRLAKESGCVQFLFGYEIFGGSLEKQQGGKFALEKQYVQFTKKIKDVGIRIKAHFIYGFDSDTLKNAFKMWAFCFKIRPAFTCISLLTPLPGSYTYYEMLRDNRIINYNWRSYDCHNLVFQPKHISPLAMRIVFPIVKFVCFLTTSKMGYGLLLFAFLQLMIFGWLKP